MKYTIASHPTIYKDILFRSRLEARWAAFLDLVDWKWRYEPIDYHGWTPDFQVWVPCRQPDVPPEGHLLSVEVKPTAQQLAAHITNEDFYKYGQLPCGSVAYFGPDPSISCWTMVCGDGGGEYKIPHLVDEWYAIWAKAGQQVMYKKPVVYVE